MIISIRDRIAGIDPPVRKVTAAEALAESYNNHGIIIDVREPGEQDTDPVPYVHRIPRGMLEIKVPDLVTNPDQPIYLHCASGIRAQLGAEQLQKMGYNYVAAITCGVKTIQTLLYQQDNSPKR